MSTVLDKNSTDTYRGPVLGFVTHFQQRFVNGLDINSWKTSLYFLEINEKILILLLEECRT